MEGTRVSGEQPAPGRLFELLLHLPDLSRRRVNPIDHLEPITPDKRLRAC